jgi:protein involved in ribonucleotide reduction
MLIVYLSLSGNVRNFVKRVEMDSVELEYTNPLTEVNEDYIVIAPSYDDEITDIISEFIDYKNNLDYLVGFVGSGNINYNKSFCFNAVDLSNKYSKPLIFTFELKGTDNDILEFKKEVDRVEIARTK